MLQTGHTFGSRPLSTVCMHMYIAYCVLSWLKPLYVLPAVGERGERGRGEREGREGGERGGQRGRGERRRTEGEGRGL